MSTKIYSGMIATVHDPFEVKARIEAVIRPLYDNAMIACVELARAAALEGKTWNEVFYLPPKTVVSTSAAYELKGDAGWDSPIADRRHWGFVLDLADLVWEAGLALKPQSTINWSPLDLHYEVIVYPNARAGKKPLVLLFCERLSREMHAAILEEGIVQEYGYWNNSDRPDNLSKKQWRHREEAWEVLGYSSIGSYGLSFGTPSKFDASWPVHQHFERQSALNPGQVLDHNLRQLLKTLHDGSLEARLRAARTTEVFTELMAELDALG